MGGKTLKAYVYVCSSSYLVKTLKALKNEVKIPTVIVYDAEYVIVDKCFVNVEF